MILEAPLRHYLQELQTFLEAEGPLSNSLDWQNLQPLQGSFLDGASRLPKQLLGDYFLCAHPILWHQSLLLWNCLLIIR